MTLDFEEDGFLGGVGVAKFSRCDKPRQTLEALDSTVGGVPGTVPGLCFFGVTIPKTSVSLESSSRFTTSDGTFFDLFFLFFVLVDATTASFSASSVGEADGDLFDFVVFVLVVAD